MPKPITSCGLEVTFSYRCPKDWQSLTCTEDPKVRFCATCKKGVHLVETDTELAAALRERRCVAIELESVEPELPSGGWVVGELSEGP